jgi:hypothetical protein
VKTWDTVGWQSGHDFSPVDTYTVHSGTYHDGSPAVAAPTLCGMHWFDVHPDHRKKALVANAAYGHGTRFLEIDGQGRFTEVGYFLPWGGSTSAVYWITDDILYTVDSVRGIDILRWTGD